jgi:taurine dioxygenase
MIRFTRASGALGADVHGVDLTKPLDRQQVGEIWDGLNTYHVLFFREQTVLTVAQHMALASNFGIPEPPPFQRETGAEPVLMLDQYEANGSQAANFHSDNTFRPSPPLGAMLQAQIVPQAGGDTCFASMHAAYEGLSKQMQGFLEGLEAFHAMEQMMKRLAGKNLQARWDLTAWPPFRHPVIATHPRTGRKLLNVNYNWTTHIDGIPPDESAAILKFLYEHVKRPEFQVRLRWAPGDMAFWDNRATQHYAVPDYAERRLMQRVSILDF